MFIVAARMAAVAAVVVVHIPAGASTDEEPIFLLASDPIVLSYPCLPWVTHPAAGGIPARSSVPLFVAIRAFLLRNSIGTDAASLASATTRSTLTITFTAAAWSRWFTELVASGLLASAPFARIRDSDAALETLTINNPAALCILAADFSRSETFDLPGTAAVPGRGRVGQVNYRAPVPAGPPTPGPPELSFVHFATLRRLQSPDPICPLLAFCRLAGALGPCSTQAIRGDIASSVRITALAMRSRVAKIAGLDSAAPMSPANDALIASDLAGAIQSAFDSLSPAFALSTLTEGGLRNELRDAFTFLHGSAAERETVISRRLIFVDDRLACMYGAPGLARIH